MLSDEQLAVTYHPDTFIFSPAHMAGLRAVEAAVRADGEKVLARMNREWASMAIERNALTEQLAAAQAVIAEANERYERDRTKPDAGVGIADDMYAFLAQVKAAIDE